MCGVTNCPLADREVRALRTIVDELTEESALNSLNVKMDAGRLLFDVAQAVGIDPWAVLNPAVMTRLANEDQVRLWPSIDEGAGDELAETDAIRQPEYSDILSTIPVAPWTLANR